jgi:hypothetical protein
MLVLCNDSTINHFVNLKQVSSKLKAGKLVSLDARKLGGWKAWKPGSWEAGKQPKAQSGPQIKNLKNLCS